MKKLLAVDGNSILNRAFYGVRALTNRDGFPTNALFGMVNMIERQVVALHPDYLAVAFDLHAPTFRHKMYDAYKAGRRPMPDELRRQFPVAKDCLSMFGFHILEAEGYEADDILGTLAKMSTEADSEAYLLTGDRDSLQLIGENTRVLLATNTETLTMDRDAFFAKYGVEPTQFVDVKALMGDSSDNIPGVPGIGEKTALSLISQFSSLDGVYAQYEEAKLTPSVKTRLANGKDSAYLSRKLARIFCEVPLGLTLDDLCDKGIDRPALAGLFRKLEFTSFIKRFGLGGAENETGTVATETASRMDIKEVGAKDLPDADPVSATLTDGKLTVYDGENVYRCTDALPALSEYLSARRTILYDCKQFYKDAQAAGVHLRTCFRDVMLGAYIENSGEGSYDLDRLVSRYLGEIRQEKLPDAVYLYRLSPVIDEKISASGQEKLLSDIELPLAAVLADMELAGFRVDTDGITAFGRELEDTAKQLEERIYYYAGGEFNVNSPKQLGSVLFERLGLPSGKKTKTGYSTNAEVLEKLRPVHPIIEEILEYRQVTKLKSTYADGLVKVADADGRIHTSFKQTGTATGRLSSAEPNLQNIPIRTELGRRFRKYFIPENRDYVLIDADYSQIELRLLAAISGDRHMTEAFLEGQDIHASTAARVFGVPQNEVTTELRKRAKAINFGILYGMGEFSLAEDLGISRYQAKAYIDSYLSTYPAIDRYLHNIVKEGYEKGYVTTMFGRRRYIPELAAHNKNLNHFGERVAMNSPIQGSAADIIKIAMIRVSDRLKKSGIDARLILQVHDELLVEANRNCVDEAYAILKEEMEHAVDLPVPLRVGIASGDNWFDAH